MSRSYDMTVRVRGMKQDRIKDVQAAAASMWPFDEWYPLDYSDIPTNQASDGQGSLCGGETEEAFTERLAKAVWKANGDYCEVEVQALYLDELPYETYICDEDRYEELTEEPCGDPGSDLLEPPRS